MTSLGFGNRLTRRVQRGRASEEGGPAKREPDGEKQESEQAQKQTDVNGGLKATALSLCELS